MKQLSPLVRTGLCPLLLVVVISAVSCDQTSRQKKFSESQLAAAKERLREARVKAQIARLKSDYEKQINEFKELTLAADSAEELVATQPVVENFAKQMLAIANQNPNSEASLEALLWVVDALRMGGASREAIRMIGEHHLESKQLGNVCLQLSSCAGPHIEKFLQAVSNGSPHRDVRAIAIYCHSKNLNFTAQLSKLVKEGGPQTESTLEILDQETVDYLLKFTPNRSRMESLLRQVINDYPDVDVNGERLSSVAAQAIEYLENHPEQAPQGVVK